MDAQLDVRLKAIERALGIGVEGKNEVTRVIPFDYNLGVGQGVRLEEPSPVTGVMFEVTMHFPNGCNGLVEMALHYRDIQVFPKRDYIRLNNATPVWKVHQPVEKHQPIWVDMRNRDTLFTHHPSVTVSLLGVE